MGRSFALGCFGELYKKLKELTPAPSLGLVTSRISSKVVVGRKTNLCLHYDGKVSRRTGFKKGRRSRIIYFVVSTLFLTTSRKVSRRTDVGVGQVTTREVEMEDLAQD